MLPVTERHLHFLAKHAGPNSERRLIELTECGLCGHLEFLRMVLAEKSEIVVVRASPDRCTYCKNIQTTHPEVYFWIVRVVTTLSQEYIDTLNGVSKNIDNFVKSKH